MATQLEQDFGSRLVTLTGDKLGLREGMRIKATVPKDAGTEPIVDFVSSDETLDRYNEIIEVAGWQLTNYLRNPVFQDSHDYSTILRTIGKASVTEIRAGAMAADKPGLYQRMVFAVNENPLAKIAYGLYKGGFLHAVSVGFIPMEWTNGDKTAGYRRKYLKQELLETSAVSIPANPEALALGIKSGAVEKSDVRELAQLLKHFCSEKAAGDDHTRDLGVTGDESHLLQLLRETARVCRKA